jgi:hypothetical protein
MSAIAPPSAFFAVEPPQAAVRPNPTEAPANPNQAQGAPAPEDTVALANQAAEGQGTGQGGNGADQQAGAFFPGGAAAANANPAAQAQEVPPITLPPLAPVNLNNLDQLPATNTAAAGTVNPNASQATTGLTNQPATPQTPAEELTQLDQTLQEIGVNPQSIALYSRMSMLLYANDPAALRVLVQTLQSSQQEPAQGNNSGASGASASAGQISQASATTASQGPANNAQATTAAQAATPAQTTIAAQPTAGAPSPGPAAASPATTNGTTNSGFARFQQTSTAIDRELAQQGNANAGASYSASSINISV